VKIRPIGIFDSGIGGLTVAKEIMRQLPYEDIVYFGDTARLPYGTKSNETVVRFSIENILFLFKKEAKLICVACNTASSIALSELKKYFKLPIIGVINPGAKEALRVSKNKRIGVIGTIATIRSRAYEKEIKRLSPSAKIISIACPLFVPLVEEGWLEGKIVLEVAKKYLAPLKNKGIDTLILGCTHYPLLKPLIQEVLGPEVKLIDSSTQIAKEVKDILKQEKLLNKKRIARRNFYVSDDPEGFRNLAKRFLGYRLNNVKKITL